MSVSICQSVCLCVVVCPRSYLRNYTSDLHRTGCACKLWLWLGPPLAACWYVVYFRFMGDVIFSHKPRFAGRRRPDDAQCTRSLGPGYTLCAVIPVAGQRTHGTTFQALNVTSQVATLGAESAVYDCFVLFCKMHWQNTVNSNNITKQLAG